VGPAQARADRVDGLVFSGRCRGCAVHGQLVERYGGSRQDAAHVALADVEEEVRGDRGRAPTDRIGTDLLPREADHLGVDSVESAAKGEPAAEAAQPGAQHLKRDPGGGAGAGSERGVDEIGLGLGRGPDLGDEVVGVLGVE
jgi:hypothetical protein